MKVDTMRRIDRWAGIPITMFISLLCSISKLFGRHDTPNVRRTLLIELSEMGSVIIADPAMRKLQNNGAELFFVIFSDNVKSLTILNTILAENVFSIRSQNILFLAYDCLRFVFWCRQKRMTTCIDMELFSRFSAILSFFSGAANRIGFTTHLDEGCYRGNIHTRYLRYNSHVHMAENFMALVNTALGKNDSVYGTFPIGKNELVLTRKQFSKEERERVREKIRQIYPSFRSQKIILMNPNASDLLPQRQWLTENFCTVIQTLLTEFANILVIITGAPKEYDRAENLRNQVADTRCLNSAGVFSFDELIALYDISTAMLTNDSGPNHFSAVTNLKVYAIFGPETPALYGSLGNSENVYLALPCSPCVSAFNHRNTSCLTRPCITGITAKMVLKRMLPYLKKHV